MKKLLQFSVLVLAFALCILPFNISAQTPATDSGTIIKDAIKEKVKEELSSIQKNVAKRSFVGPITKIDGLNITITNLVGNPRSIVASTDTTIKLTGSKDGTIKDLKEKDFLIAMGDVDSAGVLTAKRIVVAARETDSRQTLTGNVTKVSSTSLTIVGTDSNPITVTLSQATKMSTLSPVKTVKDIKVGDTIYVIGRPTPQTSKTNFAGLRIYATTGATTTSTTTPSPSSTPRPSTPTP